MVANPVDIVSANPLTTATAGLGSFLGSVASIFDGGLGIYANVKERLNAIDQIDEETVTTPSKSVAAPGSGQNPQDDVTKALMRGQMALVAAGILGVILVLMILKRRR